MEHELVSFGYVPITLKLDIAGFHFKKTTLCKMFLNKGMRSKDFRFIGWAQNEWPPRKDLMDEKLNHLMARDV